MKNSELRSMCGSPPTHSVLKIFNSILILSTGRNVRIIKSIFFWLVLYSCRSNLTLWTSKSITPDKCGRAEFVLRWKTKSSRCIIICVCLPVFVWAKLSCHPFIVVLKESRLDFEVKGWLLWESMKLHYCRCWSMQCRKQNPPVLTLDKWLIEYWAHFRYVKSILCSNHNVSVQIKKL